MTNEKRIAGEKSVARFAVEHMHSQGYSLSVYDGEETVLDKSRVVADILNAMHSTDEDVLTVYRADGKRLGWLWFVYGNSPAEVSSDYSVSLESDMKVIEPYADKFEVA